MRKICAWCNRPLSTASEKDERQHQVTHGICVRCAQSLLARYPASLGSFLDRPPAPVLVIEPEPRVFTANEAARLLLGKELPAIEGRGGAGT
ncbi:MAG: hypothetical protein JXQ27_03590 [Acidobacteria bacterium]|nr:hypothetical protein [Acidobacteriota bacterium]